MAIGRPSQQFVPVRDIQNGVVVLNDGSLRMILMTSSLNFGLKSVDEQAAIILQFQNFLNSLEFPVQIFIQSKRLDIRPYIKMLEEREKAQLIDNMRIQINQYIAFIKRFTAQTNVMSKTFFVVVPYTRITVNAKGAGSPFGGGKKERLKEGTDEMRSFEESRAQLEQRTNIVEQGLTRCDIHTTRLGTEEVTELFYRKFNPGELDSAIATA